MRFATYNHGTATGGPDGSGAGVVQGDQIHPLPPGVALADLLRDGRAALHEAGEAALARTGTVPLASVALLPPLHPASIRDFIAFEAHIEGVVRAMEKLSAVPETWYPVPGFYFTNPHAALGPYDDMPVPPLCQVLDFECEVGAVLAGSGRNLTTAQARGTIAGYLIFNDWSARDLQRPERELGLGFAKGKDSAHTLGPWLVTADELEPYRDGEGFLDLTMTVELNGAVIGKDSLASMSWTFEELVAYASRGTWVRSGDVLASGTCGGGCLAEMWGRSGSQEPPPLRPGDLVTLTVEGIGSVSNRIVANAEPVVAVPRARTRARGPRH